MFCVLCTSCMGHVMLPILLSEINQIKTFMIILSDTILMCTSEKHLKEKVLRPIYEICTVHKTIQYKIKTMY